ncbi:stage VI sporulation protein F [Tenuibacillus multivorans]|uniref:Stage VI sporulation protein F n=1 Tax=Tenuibacillus multivorans TaxID=237069 RepID=A0A1H0CVJ1_9BACI|nr:stage VI sporulation protein F [Tenuibacillus multivorans]GEL76147.1 sporulation-specific transcription factor SpoVIF [Tenuibacillus multivorans]SDN61909.1 Stage VI sporulation protein F [Tenuibacillus multivorans]
MSQDFQQSIFEHLKKTANISPDEVMGVAQSVQNANFSDEKTVRQLVQQLANMADRPLGKQKEDRIVELITKKGDQLDYSALQQIFKK